MCTVEAKQAKVTVKNIPSWGSLFFPSSALSVPKPHLRLFNPQRIISLYIFIWFDFQLQTKCGTSSQWGAQARKLLRTHSHQKTVHCNQWQQPIIPMISPHRLAAPSLSRWRQTLHQRSRLWSFKTKSTEPSTHFTGQCTYDNSSLT